RPRSAAARPRSAQVAVTSLPLAAYWCARGEHMTILVLIAAAAAGSLKVDPDAGNNKFDATFDAPLGEKIIATSSAVNCELTLAGETASGTCSVPLTSIMVDNEPTKTEHFQQWATNKKSDPKSCK